MPKLKFRKKIKIFSFLVAGILLTQLVPDLSQKLYVSTISQPYDGKGLTTGPKGGRNRVNSTDSKVKKALTEFFSEEIKQYPDLKDYLYDKNSAPYLQAQSDLISNVGTNQGYKELLEWMNGLNRVKNTYKKMIDSWISDRTAVQIRYIYPLDGAEPGDEVQIWTSSHPKGALMISRPER